MFLCFLIYSLSVHVQFKWFWGNIHRTWFQFSCKSYSCHRAHILYVWYFIADWWLMSLIVLTQKRATDLIMHKVKKQQQFCVSLHIMSLYEREFRIYENSSFYSFCSFVSYLTWCSPFPGCLLYNCLQLLIFFLYGLLYTKFPLSGWSAFVFEWIW